MTEPLDLRKEEYASLRREIEMCLAEFSDLERNCVLASAAAYAWVSSSAAIQAYVTYVAWFIPIVIPVYGLSRTYAVGKHLKRIGGYIRLVEQGEAFRGSGWETYLERERNSTGADASNKIRTTFWSLFLACSVAASGLGLAESWYQGSRAAAHDRQDFRRPLASVSPQQADSKSSHR